LAGGGQFQYLAQFRYLALTSAMQLLAEPVMPRVNAAIGKPAVSAAE
jgi:hypothetical protein